MTARLFLCCALFACGIASARPLVIESHKQLPEHTGWLAHHGNQLLMVNMTGDYTGPQPLYTYDANLYTRTASGAWVLSQTLASEVFPEHVPRSTVALNDSIAAVVMPSGLRIFERNGAIWEESPLDVSPRPRGQPMDMQGNVIVATESDCAKRVLELRKGAIGRWNTAATMASPLGACVKQLDTDGDQVILRAQTELTDPARVRIYARSGASWVSAANFVGSEADPQDYGQAIAIRGALALVSGRSRGAYVYRRSGMGWVMDGFFPNPDSGEYGGDGSIQINEQYILRTASNINRFATVAALYRAGSGGTFEHLANFAGDRDNYLSLSFISGNRIFGLGGDIGNQIVEFEVPTSFETPPLVQYDFESANGSGPLQVVPGSQFVQTSNGITQVYRQASLAGDAGAIHGADMIHQSIAADIRINAFNGEDRWVGLMTRYTDDANYYYITLRDSNWLILKRMQDGVFTELARASVNVVAGETYHLRLDSSGSYHGVYLDGQKVAFAHDKELTHGRAGIRMYKAAADYDNLVISPGPTSEMEYAFRKTEGGNWTGDTQNFAQTYSTITARRTTGWPRVDQSVQSTVNVTAFSHVGSPWVGLITRYVDANNYWYVTARKGNRLSLRKLTDGVVAELANVPYTVTPGKPFVLRFDAIGTRLRVYVNDVLMIERPDAPEVAGKVGVMTYRASATFSNYTAYEP
jgi:hypothetical protein